MEVPDTTPLYSIRHPVYFDGLDITKIPELIGLYDCLSKKIRLMMGLVWNDDEQYYEGSDMLFERAEILIGESFEPIINWYKNNFLN